MNVDKIQFRRSATAGREPTTSEVSEGELFINLVDKTIYTQDDEGNIISVGGGGAQQYLKDSIEETNIAGKRTFTISYFVGNLEVYLNGLQLTSEDFTAEDGRTFVLTTPVQADDDVITAKSYRGGEVVTDTFASMPVGTISQFLKGFPIPEGQLELNGSNYSKVDYPSLFAYLGTETLPNLNDAQVGDIMPWMSNADIPEGWHHLKPVNSSEFGSSTRWYFKDQLPEFYEFLKSNGNMVHGTHEGREYYSLPLNASGEVFRQVIDEGFKGARDSTKPWDWQNDAIRPATGKGWIVTGQGKAALFSSFAAGVIQAAQTSEGYSATINENAYQTAGTPEGGTNGIDFDISRMHPVAKDVRMANRSVNWLIKVKPTSTTSQTIFCIKAAGKLNEEGLMQVTALKEKVAQLEAEMPPKPNLFINGDFSVWQRGESFDINPAKITADRWWVGHSGVDLQTVQLQPTDAADAIYTKHVLGIRHRKEGVNTAYIYQKIELDTSHQGKQVTYSGRFKFTNPMDMQVAFVWVKVSDGEHVSPVVRGTIQATKGINEIAMTTVTLPTIAAYDPSVEYCLLVSNEYANGGSAPVGYYYFGNLKLELGSVATPFVPDDPATNLAKCQRYYYKSGFNGTSITMYDSNRFLTGRVQFPVTMRETPTITKRFGSCWINGKGFTGTYNNTNWQTSTTGFVSDHHSVNPAQSSYANGWIDMQFEADAEL